MELWTLNFELSKLKMKYHLRIEPKKSLFDINLKELWAYRDLIALFVRRGGEAVDWYWNNLK